MYLFLVMYLFNVLGHLSKGGTYTLRS